MKVYERYVAIGDSTTEGLDDPDGNGGYRGWANRFAELVAAQQKETLLYANLAVRGLRTRQILDTQLERALLMNPDLSTVVSGTNDVLRKNFDVNAFGKDVEHMQRALIQQGATVLTFTLPDLSSIMPTARLVAERVKGMNQMVRDVSASTGAIVVDLAAYPVASDPRVWSVDRLHANAAGHARIGAALAHAIAVPGSDASWQDPLPPAPRKTSAQRARENWEWTRDYLMPWIMRRVRGKSSGDNIECKRPNLLPVEL